LCSISRNSSGSGVCPGIVMNILTLKAATGTDCPSGVHTGLRPHSAAKLISSCSTVANSNTRLGASTIPDVRGPSLRASARAWTWERTGMLYHPSAPRDTAVEFEPPASCIPRCSSNISPGRSARLTADGRARDTRPAPVEPRATGVGGLLGPRSQVVQLSIC